MYLFGNTLDRIKGIVEPVNSFSQFNESKSILASTATSNSVVSFNQDELCKLFGKHKYSIQKPFIGNHPDFVRLAHGETENHYAVSMFMDIKGSTRLVSKYSLPQIRLFKDTILTLAIHVCNFFGGHIQRLQGDGIFVYFAGRNQHPSDAVINALNAASLLCYFIKDELPVIGEAHEFENIKVRIGIDYGAADKVLWSYYGLEGCRELTTTSLHTDLAAKLQACALPNTIMIGDNVKKILDIPDTFIQAPCKKDSAETDYYIYRDQNILYRKWIFDWNKYLKSFSFFHPGEHGLKIEETPNKLECIISSIEGNRIIYPQNLFSIPKGYRINFTLKQGVNNYILQNGEAILWRVVNTGVEASNGNALEHNLGGQFVNSTIANTRASYLGHHRVECRISRKYNGLQNELHSLYLYIRD